MTMVIMVVVMMEMYGKDPKTAIVNTFLILFTKVEGMNITYHQKSDLQLLIYNCIKLKTILASNRCVLNRFWLKIPPVHYHDGWVIVVPILEYVLFDWTAE